MHEMLSMNDVAWFLIVGGLAGWIASVLVEGSGLGVIGDIVVGVIGALLGGYAANRLNIDIYGFWQVLIIAVLGSVFFLIILRVMFRTRRAVDG